MNGVNKVFVLGNLGSDPEMKYTGSGTAVMRLRVATNERQKKGDQWTDHTEWHTVTVFGKRAEGLAKILAKGSAVHIEGKLRTRKWDDKDGNKRQATEIIADDVVVCGGRPAESAGSRAQKPEEDDPFAQYAGDDE